MTLDAREAALAASAVAALLARWPDEAGSSAPRRAYRRLLATLTTDTPAPASSPDLTSSIPPLLSADQAAELLGITPQAVTARCRAGRHDATQVGGVWVIAADSVGLATGRRAA